jgi:hypothetical protein
MAAPTPAAAVFTFPPFGLMPPLEKSAAACDESTAATAKMVRLLAGLSTGAMNSGRLLSFPAAAIISA